MIKTRYLFVVGSNCSNAKIAEMDALSKNNNEVFVIDLCKKPRIQKMKQFRKINIDDFCTSRITNECDVETNKLVTRIAAEIKKSEYNEDFSWNSLSLMDPCVIELHIYYLLKVMEQIATANKIVRDLQIDEIEIVGKLYGFPSLAAPPLKATFLWSFLIAADEHKIHYKTTTHGVFQRIRFNFFILFGLSVRIGLQLIRKIKSVFSARKLFFKMENSKVVSLCHSRNTAATENLVIEELRKSGNSTMSIYIGKNVRDFLPPIKVFDYETLFSLCQFIKCLLKIPSLFKALTSFPASETFSTIRPLSPSFHIMLKYLFVQFAVTRFSAALCYLYISDHVLEKANPSVLLLAMESNARERAFALAAKKRGIVTIMIQTGLYNKTDELHKYGHNATYAFVESVYARETFIEFKYDPDHIVITGQPSYIYLKKRLNAMSKESIRSELGIPGNKPVLLYAPQCFDYTLAKDQQNINRRYCAYEETMKDTYEKLKELQSRFDFFIVIKPHPRELMELHEKLKKDVGLTNTLLVDRASDPYRLFPIIKGMVSTYSTLVTEALFYGKPAIILADKNKEFKEWPFSACESIFEVFTDEAFENAVQKVVASEEDWENKSIQFFNRLSDGHAEDSHKYIASLIQDHIK